MGDSEENLDLLFLDNYVPKIEKKCVKKFFLKKKMHIKNIVNEIHEEILEFFSDVIFWFFLGRFGEDLRITLI